MLNRSTESRHATGAPQDAILHQSIRQPHPSCSVDNSVADHPDGHLPAIIPHFQPTDCLAEPVQRFCTPRIRINCVRRLS